MNRIRLIIIQSLLATLVIFIICLFLTGHRPAIVASLSASACLVFSMPSYRPARSVNVIGGHLIGLTCGAIFLKLGSLWAIHPAFIYSLAVGLSILLMNFTSTNHPPAAGTAFGIALNGVTLEIVATVIFSTIALSIIRNFLKPYIKDLV